jgi:ATP-dependent RNA helicase SUPV3L1/SUV3
MVSLIETRLCGMREKVTDPDFMLSTGLTKDTGREQFEEFAAGIMSALVDHSVHGKDWLPPRPYVSLRQAYELSGEGGLESQLRFMLQGHIANSGFKESDMLAHARLADLRFPHEWYPAARELHRHIHIHIGPTNSGKTYHALKRLEQAESGVYAGPLRLLAHEVYTRMNAQGKRCNLVTGDERIVSEDGEAALESCTVEMVPTGRAMDVAVIDEIQMIGHEHRGWAWTQALLGLRANEIHLCGEERALPLVRELVAATGDSLHVHKYERLTPLKTMSTSLKGDLKRLRKGDCVVMFSRRGIHAMKKEIEQTTGKKVAVVYGALPPEVRAQQARYFNDEDNDYDILVASDAVGMGLNLYACLAIPSMDKSLTDLFQKHKADDLRVDTEDI